MKRRKRFFKEIKRRKIIRSRRGEFLILLFSALVGYFIGWRLTGDFVIAGVVCVAFCIFSFFLLKKLFKLPLWKDLLYLFGGVCGLVASNLLLLPLIGKYPLVVISFNLFFMVLGIFLISKKEEQFKEIFFSKLIKQQPKEHPRFRPIPKIFDSSAIIDGRVADICETQFLEGPFIIPRFVLKEIHRLADSEDPLKRQRGRRGLEILNRLQKNKNLSIHISNMDFEEIKEVDGKLIKMAKTIGGRIVTNDFNLNKVAEIENVEVLNINELAEVLKMVLLPGEEIEIEILKEGKEFGQGVGYLQDGTMVVVDNGLDFIGKKVKTTVTSVLQTSTGRIVFTKKV